MRNDLDVKVSRPINRIWMHPDGYLEGCVFTPNGIVSVYSQGGKNDKPSTTLNFVWEGRLYVRCIPRRYSRTGLVTVANRYAAETRGGQAWLG